MSAATLSNLLDQMCQNQECLGGWDAVMNLLESSVNQFFEEQFSHQTGGTGTMSITTVWCEGVYPFEDHYFTNVAEFKAELGPPLFQFESGQANVTVRQDILSGTYRAGTKEVPKGFDPSKCGCCFNDPSVDWGAPIIVDTTTKPYLEGMVTLDQVQGIVESATTLILDFAKGSFQLNNMTVQGVDNVVLANQFKNWFAANEIKYVLASINLSNLAGASGFTPTSFQFNVVTTNAGNTVVQLLITTDGVQPPSKSITVNEPIPTDDSFTCSLMVSSRILFNDVLVSGFNANGDSFKLYASPPSGEGKAWTAYIAPLMHFEGSFTFGSCCDETKVTYSIYLGGTYTGTPTDGFHLTQSVDTTGNVHVHITVSAYYPLHLSGAGAEQQLQIIPGTPQVSVTGDAEQEIKSRLESILNTDMRNAMAAISFTPVAYFALRNLLFPSNLFRMSVAQTPADLVIVGTFEPV